MCFRIQIQRRYYLLFFVLGLIIAAPIMVVLQANFLSAAISFITISLTLTFTAKIFIKNTALQLAPQGIAFRHPFGLLYCIDYSELRDITVTDRGFSLFALSNRKVLLEWKKDNSEKVLRTVFSPLDADRFVEEVGRHLRTDGFG
jgi:hypothetical protein